MMEAAMKEEVEEEEAPASTRFTIGRPLREPSATTTTEAAVLAEVAAVSVVAVLAVMQAVLLSAIRRVAVSNTLRRHGRRQRTT